LTVNARPLLLQNRVGVALPKCIVYVLKSESAPVRYYTGLTSNLATRLDAHNAGGVHTPLPANRGSSTWWSSSLTNVAP
jgi:predicted GIY-YIG superfamily endonuclease